MIFGRAPKYRTKGCSRYWRPKFAARECSNAAETSVRAPGPSADEREHPFVWYFGAGWIFECFFSNNFGRAGIGVKGKGYWMTSAEIGETSNEENSEDPRGTDQSLCRNAVGPLAKERPTDPLGLLVADLDTRSNCTLWHGIIMNISPWGLIFVVLDISMYLSNLNLWKRGEGWGVPSNVNLRERETLSWKCTRDLHCMYMCKSITTYVWAEAEIYYQNSCRSRDTLHSNKEILV